MKFSRKSKFKWFLIFFFWEKKRRVEKKPQKENKVSEFSLGTGTHMKNLDDVTKKYGNEEEMEGSAEKQISKNVNAFSQAKVQFNKKYFNS